MLDILYADSSGNLIVTDQTHQLDVSTGYKPIAKLEIDSTKVDQAKLNSFLAKIYGTDGSTSYSAASPEGTENPYSEGWYERSGTSPDYT